MMRRAMDSKAYSTSGQPPHGQLKPVAEPLSIFDAASYILENSLWTITQLELQKLLYLAQMIHLGEYRSPILAARFEAWVYGPVNRALYDETKRYGADPLIASNIQGNSRAVMARTHKDVLNHVVNHLAGKTGAQLIRITHLEDGAWHKTFDPHLRDIEIPDQLIKDEYIQRVKRVHAKTGIDP